MASGGATAGGPGELTLIRHAPARTEGRLCGRTDVAADLPGPAALARIAARAGQPRRLVTSPALRCRTTAAALWPGLVAEAEARLWEQDFGAWEGMRLADLPDLGPLAARALAEHRAPGGESFSDLIARAAPALRALATEGATVVAHAGTVRAALSLALGLAHAGLAFDVAPLSVTRLRLLPTGDWAVLCVNVAA